MKSTMEIVLKTFATVAIFSSCILAAAPASQPDGSPNSPPIRFDLDKSFHLTAQQAQTLEDKVRVNRDDADSRAQLLGYYFLQQGPGAAATTARRGHILWMIGNHPRDPICGLPVCAIDPETDLEGFTAAKDLWLQLAGKPSQSDAVIENAVRFLIVADSKSAEELVKQALSADPNNPQWHQNLGEIYARAIPTTEPAGHMAQNALVEREQAFVLTKESDERFYILTDLPAAAMVCGDKLKTTEYAKLLLTEAVHFKKDWNYGNAIHKANLALGRVALASGDIESAKARLLDAGKTPGSPQLNSFGPNMVLAQKLLKKGEKEAVLQYFDLCGKFWQGHDDKLDEWRKAIKAGKAPDFGANLLY